MRNLSSNKTIGISPIQVSNPEQVEDLSANRQYLNILRTGCVGTPRPSERSAASQWNPGAPFLASFARSGDFEVRPELRELSRRLRGEERHRRRIIPACHP